MKTWTALSTLCAARLKRVSVLIVDQAATIDTPPPVLVNPLGVDQIISAPPDTPISVIEYLHDVSLHFKLLYFRVQVLLNPRPSARAGGDPVKGVLVRRAAEGEHTAPLTGWGEDPPLNEGCNILPESIYT
jgi:hypothetical protein